MPEEAFRFALRKADDRQLAAYLDSCIEEIASRAAQTRRGTIEERLVFTARAAKRTYNAWTKLDGSKRRLEESL